MKAIKYVLVASMLCASAPVFAQSPAAPATASAVVTPEQKAAVKELLDAMNFKQMMSQMATAMTQSMPQMLEQMSASDASLTTEQKVEARRLSSQASTTAMNSVVEIYNDPQVIQGMEDIMARTYAKNFSIDEVKAITAFYVSPAGKKTLTTLPQVMQQTMPEITALVAPRMKDAMTKITQNIIAQAKSGVKSKGVSPAKSG